jgi:hypothetical protein
LIGAWNWSATLAPRKTESGNGKKSTLPSAPTDGAINGNGRRLPGLPVDALQALQALPPLLVALSYQNNELRLELRQRDPQRLRAVAIERCLTWYVKTRSINLYSGRFDGDGPVPIEPPLFLPGGP